MRTVAAQPAPFAKVHCPDRYKILPASASPIAHTTDEGPDPGICDASIKAMFVSETALEPDIL